MILDERDAVVAQFGVSPEQVERDHLISHLLAAIADRFADRVHFIGAPRSRVLTSRAVVSARTSILLLWVIGTSWPSNSTLHSNVLSRGHTVVCPGSRRSPPSEIPRRRISVPAAVCRSRSSCCPPATGRCGRQNLGGWSSATATRHRRHWLCHVAAFAAGKTATWHDRRAPRDLWDLWALAAIGAIDVAAADLFRRHGPTNNPPGPYLFRTPPSESAWSSQLAAQTRLNISAASALATVRNAWARVTDHELGDRA